MAQRIHGSIEIQAPFYDVFTYWSNLENFLHLMQNAEEVRVARDTSHRLVKRSLGKSVEFDARITEANPERRISWQIRERRRAYLQREWRGVEPRRGRRRLESRLAREAHRPGVTNPMCQSEPRSTCRNLLPLEVRLWALRDGEEAAGAATEAS